MIDSHTEGEPTRVVIDGWPQPTGATMLERRDDLRRRFDHLRRGTILEPRGHDAVVGAVLTPPVSDGAVAGVIFFNDASYLGMCGHGTIGVVRTLEYLGRIAPGPLLLDTPAGPVGAELHADGSVTVRNVPSHRHRADVVVEVPGLGPIKGDVAYGGNWFFLADRPAWAPALEMAHVAELLRQTILLRAALAGAGITGSNGDPVDHVEFYDAPRHPAAHSRNFVLCPGGAYDRSPCGTGTSAKLAVLAARGALSPGEIWVQESITGSLFQAWLAEHEGVLQPHIRGRAFITARSTLRFDPADPFRYGLEAPPRS